MMPGGLTGWEIQGKMKASGLVIPMVFISAISDVAALKNIMNNESAAVLRKPFTETELIKAIEVASQKAIVTTPMPLS